LKFGAVLLRVKYQKGVDLLSFLMGLGATAFLPDDGVADNCNTGQIAVLKEK
jgi:hypothetical protein